MSQGIDLGEAQRFLSILDEEADEFCFRVFDDDTERNDTRGARKLDGTLESVAKALEAASRDRRGVFVVVNEGGQDAGSIQRVRAVFADTDGADLAPMLACDLEPHAIIESSPGRWHVYWLVDGLPLDRFRDVQQAIAAEFGTDRSICDLPRVMRLPGSLHQKGEPFRVRLIHESGARPYTAERVLERFQSAVAVTPAAAVPPLSDVVTVGRHAAILKETTFLADDVRRGHLTRDEALAVMDARRAAGRYSRDVPDDEIERALDGALGKSAARPDAEPAIVRALKPVDLSGAMSAQDAPWPHVVDHYFPRRVVTLLGGHGGAGKSMLALALAAHVAAGRPWGPLSVAPDRVVFLSFEDEGEEVMRRVGRITAAYELPFDEILRNLFVLDGSDTETELALETPGGGLEFTPLMGVVAEAIRGAGLVIIDNSSDTYGANENERRQVRRFVRRLAQEARTNDAAVVLLAHVDKQAAKGTGRGNNYSGSTQWHNSVRSRLALVESEEAGIELVHEKANYGPRHEVLALQRVAGGVLVPVAAADAAASRAAAEAVVAQADAEVVFGLLEALLRDGTTVPTAEVGQRTTYHVLSQAREFPERFRGPQGKARVKAAVLALARAKRIERQTYRTADRKERERWALAQIGAGKGA